MIIGIQPLGQFGQRSELSQATGMTLVRCILGKFLEVVCHCFPPHLDIPTFATRCLHVQNTLNTQHFIVQLMHATLKKVELIKHFKIKVAAPICFGLQGNNHQGATASTGYCSLMMVSL